MHNLAILGMNYLSCFHKNMSLYMYIGVHPVAFSHCFLYTTAYLPKYLLGTLKLYPFQLIILFNLQFTFNMNFIVNMKFTVDMNFTVNMSLQGTSLNHPIVFCYPSLADVNSYGPRFMQCFIHFLS